MKCRHCGTENPDDAAFCRNSECGKPLAGDSVQSLLHQGIESKIEMTGSMSEELRPPKTGSQSKASRPIDEDPKKSLDANLLETITEFGHKTPIISVIGFAKSGKTFFVNRLRYELPRIGKWQSYPVRKAKIPLSSEGIELTYLTPVGSTAAADHHERYLIADCAGPAFEAMQTETELEGVRVPSEKASSSASRAASAEARRPGSSELL